MDFVNVLVRISWRVKAHDINHVRLAMCMLSRPYEEYTPYSDGKYVVYHHQIYLYLTMMKMICWGCHGFKENILGQISSRGNFMKKIMEDGRYMQSLGRIDISWSVCVSLHRVYVYLTMMK